MCSNCQNKVLLCLNAFIYECGKCKRNNDVNTTVNTELVAGSLNIRKLLIDVDKTDYLKINNVIINYLIDNKEHFKHRCKCRAINEFDTAKQQYICPHCGETGTVTENLI